jgi:GNAT superfamily N-acetyltransferase
VRIVEFPEGVLRQALHPFRVLPAPPGFQRVECGRFLAMLHPLPFAQIVEPGDLAPDEVGAAVEEARTVVREHSRSLLIWLVGPEHRWLGERLEELGLVNADTPGFEATENAMALTGPPPGEAPPDVRVHAVRSFVEFEASQRLSGEVFGMTAEMLDEMEANLSRLYEEYVTPGNPLRQFNASIDGRVVGTAAVGLGPAGVNLFGGSVLAEARGRGVYRALTLARWDLAVAEGTPALTIQAGRMSKPIAERLGFQLIDTIRVYVDDFSGL